MVTIRMLGYGCSSGWIVGFLMAAFLALVAAGPALAHTTVAPAEVPAGEKRTLTLTVQGEKEIPIVEERVEVPEGFVVTEVRSPEGWQGQEEGGAVVWKGGGIRQEERQEFTFTARAPQEAGDYVFRAFGTYSDGSVSEWTGPPDSDAPASVVRVVAGDASGGNREDHSHEGSGAGEADLPGTGGPAPVDLIALEGLALLAGVGLLMRRACRT